MEFILEFEFLEFELPFENLDELSGILLEHLGDRQLNGPVVFDDDNAAGDGDFAIGESVEGIDELLGADAAGGFDFDFDLFGGEIVDALDLDLSFARGVFDGTD